VRKEQCIPESVISERENADIQSFLRLPQDRGQFFFILLAREEEHLLNEGWALEQIKHEKVADLALHDMNTYVRVLGACSDISESLFGVLIHLLGLLTSLD
jgi:secreted Zn-dependent insulinase-like peptidase